jgi:hypothetical protein
MTHLYRVLLAKYLAGLKLPVLEQNPPLKKSLLGVETGFPVVLQP